MRESLRRRLREIGGLALILLAGAVALALATWSVKDPSLSHATNAPIRNTLGMPGAVVADLLMQTLGVAAIALVLPIAIWGWRLITHRQLNREPLRLLFWIVGLTLAAGCAAALPRGATWPLPAGLGGVVGDALVRLPTWLAGGTLNGWTRVGLVLASGLAMLTCFAIASGFGLQSPPKEKKKKKPVEAAPVSEKEDDEERAWVSLGWLAHGFLSLKARISRLLAGRNAAKAPPRRDAARDRRATAWSRGSRARRLPRSRRSSTKKWRDDDEEEDEDEAPRPPRKPTKVTRQAAQVGRLPVPAA